MADSKIKDEVNVNTFFQTTTAHGYIRIAKSSSNLYQKWFWIVVMIGAVVGFVINLNNLISRYLKFPISTQIYYVPNTDVYPSITVCLESPYYVNNITNNVKIDSKRFKTFTELEKNVFNFWNKYYRHLKPYNIEVIEAYRRTIFPTAWLTDVIVPPDLPLAICQTNTLQSCMNMFTKRFWFNNRPCFSGNIVDVVDIYQLQFVIFWPYESYELQPQITNALVEKSLFLSVYIHPNDTYPDGMAQSCNHEKGGLLIIKYKLSKYYSVCNNESIPNIVIVSRDNYQNISFSYSKSLCNKLETQRKIWQNCGCLSEVLPIPVEYRNLIMGNVTNYCFSLPYFSYSISDASVTLQKVQCHQTYMDNLTASHQCPNVCVSERVISSSLFPKTKFNMQNQVYAHLRKKLISADNPNKRQREFVNSTCPFDFPAFCRLRLEAHVCIEIDLAQEITVYKNSYSYSYMNLLSDIGGIMGLYLGWSCFTVIEMIVFLFGFITFGLRAFCYRNRTE